MAKRDDYEIEAAQVGFRNFEGKEGLYNREGDRSFAIFLRPEDAEELERRGYNIKETKAKDDAGYPAAKYLEITVSYKNIPPRVIMITSAGKTVLGEDMVGILDYSDVENWDAVISPYNWAVNGNTGVKAYLKTLYVTLDEDSFASKYADIPEKR